MRNELLYRIITSFFLIFILFFAFLYNFVLIISLIIMTIISFIEFYVLISKIFTTKKFKIFFLKLIINGIGLMYLLVFSILIYCGIYQIEPNFKIHMFYLFMVCICSDVGGLIFGKIFKGKKITKISPNKTISGAIGSFILSLILVPVFIFLFENFSSIYDLILVSIIVSFACQLGDLFISYIKRKSKVKDTGKFLPGHGGILDRIDGMLLAIPIGFITFKLLSLY